MGGGGVQDIVPLARVVELLERQNELLAKIERLVGRVVRSEAESMRNPRRTRDQIRQLALAFEALKNDPLHNVRQAARYAFRKTKGYKSVASLRQALMEKWNCREA